MVYSKRIVNSNYNNNFNYLSLTVTIQLYCIKIIITSLILFCHRIFRPFPIYLSD